MIYQLINVHGINGTTQALNRTDNDGKVWSIPKDLDNTDYQAYLKWVEEGNAPLPADE